MTSPRIVDVRVGYGHLLSIVSLAVLSACSSPTAPDAGDTSVTDITPSTDAPVVDVPQTDSSLDVPVADVADVAADSSDATADMTTVDVATDVPTDAPLAPAARLIAPLSTATVTGRRPTLRWELPPGADGARIEICRERACTHVVTELRGSTSASPSTDLPAGVLFWRAFATTGTTESSTPSATWQFVVGAHSAPIDASWGSTLDVNGDGFADLAVGAIGGTLVPMVGAAFVYHGSASGIASGPATTLAGTATGDFFGNRVASAGDVNGDGFGDFLVSAMNASPSGMNAAGSVFVYFGSATGVVTPAATVLDGRMPSDRFGTQAASAGDVNGDGYGDVVVGAANNGGTIEQGSVYVFLGSATGLSTSPATTMTYSGTTMDVGFGTAVTSAGDIDNDGFGDVAASVYGAAVGGRAGVGIVNIYRGSAAGLITTPAFVLEGVNANDFFGSHIANAGDVNSDGYPDLAVHAGGADPGGRMQAGTVSVFLGSATGPVTTPQVVYEGQNRGDNFGSSVASAGDVNGDGFGDFLIGATAIGYPDMRIPGTVTVYLGGAAGLASTPFATLTGPGDGDEFGRSAIGLGDANGDGFGDVAIGAPWQSDPFNRSFAGVTDLYNGSATALTFFRRARNGTLRDSFGWSVASRGEILPSRVVKNHDAQPRRS